MTSHNSSSAEALNDVDDHDSETPTPLLAGVIKELSTDTIKFTGERFVFGSGVEIFYEHYNRYLFASRYIQSHETVLDLGCGIGYGSILLSEKAKKVISIDKDPESIAQLQQLTAQCSIKNIEAHVLDLAQLSSLQSDPIDVVICHELIEHISRAQQLALIQQLSKGETPFHKKTKLFMSTPERRAYTDKNRSKNPYHEFEFSKEEFIDFISSHYAQRKFFWQGNITGNIIVEATAHTSSIADVGYVHWQDIARSQGSADSTPEQKGLYLYAIASHDTLPSVKTGILLDQSERLIIEKLSIAAKELNEKEQERRLYKNESRKTGDLLMLQKLLHDKVRHLLKSNECAGADLQDASRAIQATAQNLAKYENEIFTIQEHRANLLPWRDFVQQNLGSELIHAQRQLQQMADNLNMIEPVEIKFAIALMRRLPGFIKIPLRKILGFVMKK